MIALWHINDVILNYYFAIGGIFISYLVYRILHSLLCGNNYMITIYNPRGHTWRSIQCNKSIPYNIFCNVCSKLMLPVVGLFCECCGISACKKCRRTLEKKNKCKVITWPGDKVFHHLWVNVGVTHSESADQSNEDLRKVFCSWCQRIKTIGTNLNDSVEDCDFGKYQNIIIPPSCVVVEKGVVATIKPLPNPDWEPLIIFANRKSGSNRSDEVLSLFRGILNPIQVVDIGSVSPESVVRWLPNRCRVLVAGGDGTVAWVLNALADSTIRAPVAVMPMGTGNDLSRVLGWGGSCGSQLNAHSVIRAVTQAIEQPLDRWKITIKPKKSRLRRVPAERSLYAYNYASIGVDAQIALDFHEARTLFLYRYASRTINYMAYLFLGASRTLDDGGYLGLERRLHVRVDENSLSLPLPSIQALVLLNIPSWCAGVDLWGMGDEGEVADQNISDGKFEVVGISSSFHIARLQCGLAEPYRFLQASHIKIELSGSSAMQVDGEPWMQGPATITMQHAGTVMMLKCNPNEL